MRDPLLWWAVVLVGAPVLVAGYAYGLYPLLLMAVARRRAKGAAPPPATWPMVTIVLPAYNEEAVIGDALDTILALDYPADRRHVLVVSDASTDRTDDIVRRYADRGVELLRLATRAGKTAAENAATTRLKGDVIVNTDASVRLAPGSLKPLVAALQPPDVGVASGRDVSVSRVGDNPNLGESRYVDYEMWVRDLETRAGGIVGASGCYYASRRSLHMEIVPAALSRDFAAPLIAREHGYRSVSVPEAVCYVPRVPSLRAEYRRKVRTMARGLETLHFKAALLNPRRHGRFAWMLFSHKLARWLVPPAGGLAILGAVLWAVAWPPARVPLAVAAALTAAVAALGWYAPPRYRPGPVALGAYVIWGGIAALQAWSKAFRRELNPLWEPTRREGT